MSEQGGPLGSVGPVRVSDPGISVGDGATGVTGSRIDLGHTSMQPPVMPEPHVMYMAECEDALGWVETAKAKKSEFTFASTAQFALGLGLTSLFAFITTQYVGLTTDNGKTAVEADGWVAPVFLVFGIVGVAWSIIAKLTGQTERTRLDDCLDNVKNVLERVRDRHPTDPPTPRL